ncbi:MAG: hypothetical protein ACW98X_23370 [Promethearchaeota archaeon]|jgi:hypothetical protein
MARKKGPGPKSTAAIARNRAKAKSGVYKKGPILSKKTKKAIKKTVKKIVVGKKKRTSSLRGTTKF